MPYRKQALYDRWAVNRGALAATAALPGGAAVRCVNTHFGPPLSVLEV